MKRYHVIAIAFLAGLICGLAAPVHAEEVKPDLMYQCAGGVVYQDIHQGEGALVYIKGTGKKAYSILLGEHNFNIVDSTEDNVAGVHTVMWDNEKGADVTTVETDSKLVIIIDGISEICSRK